MKKKKTNIKIKPRKYSLYTKKKSKGKQALAAIITIVAAAALCVVGYGAGKPIVEYFKNKQANPPESSVPWTPTFEESEQAPATAEPTAESAEPESVEPEKPAVMGAYFLPENASLSSESLNGAIAAAKSNGAQAVVVTLKDDMGHLLYKTEIEGAADTDLVTGTLTAKQICDIITKAGLTPSARINTTKDHIGGNYVGGNYMISGEESIWHDAAVANGGKRWLSPFSEKTSAYIANITAELSRAGFKEIILSNTIFPDFHPSDYTTYLYDVPISDNNARVQALWNVIGAANNAAKANGAQIRLEMSATALYSDDRLATDAEAAADKAKLAEVALLLDYDASGSSFAEAKSFIGRTGASYSGQEYAVLIKGSGFSAGALDELKRAFTESEIAVFTE